MYEFCAMHGARRLARSSRSLRLQADLIKAAARGVLILSRERFALWGGRLAPLRRQLARLRERLDAAKRVRAERLAKREENPRRLIARLERHIPRRVGVTATILILIGSAALGIVKGGHVEEVTTALGDTRNALANSVGFRITAVAISGRKQLSQDEVLAVGGVNGRSSLLFLDAATVRDKLKANPWIADATVQKFYPGQLQIDITERTAFALWQQDGRLSVISDDGAVLEPYVSRRFTGLPLVVGKGAESRARDFLATVDRYPRVRSVMKAAIFVGERRWNLRLKDGLDVRLPENDVGNALAALTKLEKDERLFSRDVVAIDMRLPDRLTVRLSEDAAKARDELFKDKKKKAGSA
jgi:cell division protein FtsQ